MRITVACVGRIRDPFEDASAHYLRLLARHAKVELVEIKEAGLALERAAEAREVEGKMLIGRLGDRAHVCAPDRGGLQLSSKRFAQCLEERRQSGMDLVFVVGGPYGLSELALKRADSSLSLGPLTLPHQLARVVLLEQLFRAHKIIAGERYHY